MRRRAFTVPVFLLLAACAGPKTPPASTGPAHTAASRAAERETLSLTVYNQNFGVVRERRRVALGVGPVELAYGDVAAELQAETVHLESASGAEALTVLEQNYRYDLLSPQTLLDKYVGKTIKVYRYDEKLGADEAKTAEVLASRDGVVLRIDGQLTYDFRGRYAFPELPQNLVEKPTLVWLLRSSAPKQSLEVSYVTRGLDWSADYVLVLAKDDTRGDLSGWVSLTNESGVNFDDAKVELVAGDVSYALERPTSVKNREKKQVSLFDAQGIGVEKRLVLEGDAGFFRPIVLGARGGEKVSVLLELANEKKNQLGMPLPKGTVHVYEADESGAQQFIGEAPLDHSAHDEKLRLKIGTAFDLVAERKQVKTSVVSTCLSESSWELTLRNHKDVAESVEVDEPTGGDFELIQSSHPPRKLSATKLAFDVAVPARGQSKLTYSLRVRWC